MDNTTPDSLMPTSRFVEVSRRAFLKKAALAAGAVAFFPSLAACGSDAEQFAATTIAAGVTTSQASPSATTVTAETTTTAAETTTTAAPTTQATSVSLPSGSEMVISFSYAASATGGRVRNPYIAVWLEDDNGELVNTVALWFLQTQKGLRWLSELRRWASVDGTSTTIDAISSATRTPGEYAVVWDGTDSAGEMVPSGNYFVCIESAREHGPYSLIREPVALANSDLTFALADDGELSSAQVTFSVA